MTDIYSVIHSIPPFILAIDISIDSIIWRTFILFFIVGAIIISLILYLYSKKPDDWKHESKIDGGYCPGRLKDLAESIKINPNDQTSDVSAKKLIQDIFFEKFRTLRGVSIDELMDLKTKDRVRLRQIVGDEEIADWILNIKKKKVNSLLKRNKIGKKEKYLMEINSVLDKMGAWGE
jgi:hypothetical protein